MALLDGISAYEPLLTLALIVVFAGGPILDGAAWIAHLVARAGQPRNLITWDLPKVVPMPHLAAANDEGDPAERYGPYVGALVEGNRQNLRRIDRINGAVADEVAETEAASKRAAQRIADLRAREAEQSPSRPFAAE